MHGPAQLRCKELCFMDFSCWLNCDMYISFKLQTWNVNIFKDNHIAFKTFWKGGKPPPQWCEGAHSLAPPLPALLATLGLIYNKFLNF